MKELLTAQLVLAELKLQTLKEDGAAKQARIAELASINEKQVASLVLDSQAISWRGFLASYGVWTCFTRHWFTLRLTSSIRSTSPGQSSEKPYVSLQTELLDAAEVEVGGYQERCAQLLHKLQALEQAAKDSARKVTELLVRPSYRNTESR